MIKKLKTSALAVLIGVSAASFGVSAASITGANLIVDGSFEGISVSGIGKFLTTAQRDDFAWGSSGQVELWNRSDAFEGDQFLELNSKWGNYSIFQEFDSTIGTMYEVSLAYKARRNLDPVEQFSVFLGDASSGTGRTVNVMNGNTQSWTEAAFTFMATSETSLLRFTAVNPVAGMDKDSYGNFLDDVKVTDVPEPGTMALLGLGLLGLGAARRRKA